MPKELKPCPFCDDDSASVKSETVSLGCASEEIWYVRCGHCKARTNDTTTRIDAIDDWNRRDPLPSPSPVADRLAEAAKKAVGWLRACDHMDEFDSMATELDSALADYEKGKKGETK